MVEDVSSLLREMMMAFGISEVLIKKSGESYLFLKADNS